MKKRLWLSLAVIPFVMACGKGDKTATAPTSTMENPTEVIASVGDQKLTAAELEESIRPRLAKVQSEIYRIRKDAASEWVNETLLEAEAKKRGIPLEKLLEDTTAGITVTEEDAKEFYEKNKARIRQDYETAKPQLMNRLRNQKKQDAIGSLLASLQKNTEVVINLEQPRVNISTDDDPSQGKQDAPITLIEFSDFQCPFCKRARGTVAEILSTYGDKVYYVFRDFPLSFHKDALLAHQAANCAHEQGKYWEYSNGLWDRQQDLKRESLLALAKSLSLKEDDFTKCLDSGKQADEIQKDIRDGSTAGVSGTPAYFINGRFLSGAQPFEAFKEIIDEELAKKK